MKTIGIIDDNEGRAVEIAAILGKAGSRMNVWRFGDAEVWETYCSRDECFETANDIPRGLVLCFWHYKNRPCGGGSKHDLPLNPSGCDGIGRVWYGGNGPEYHLDFEWNINVPLVSGAVEGQFTEPRAQQILMWCLNPNRNPNDIPELLRRAPATEALPALSILCQGYLAAFAGVAAQRGISLSADVEAALGRMHFSDIPAAFVERVKGRISEMSHRAWWRNPFEGIEWESDLRREVKDATGGEVPTDLENLIAAIRQGDAEQTLCQAGDETTADGSERQLGEAKLVAKAYCQVENMLHRDKETHVATQSKKIAPNASNDVTQN